MCMNINLGLDFISSVSSERMYVHEYLLLNQDSTNSVTSVRMYVHEYLSPENGFYQFCNLMYGHELIPEPGSVL